MSAEAVRRYKAAFEAAELARTAWSARAKEPWTPLLDAMRRAEAEEIAARDALFEMHPPLRCPKRDSHGVPCEMLEGHDPPCACPEALKAFHASRRSLPHTRLDMGGVRAAFETEEAHDRKEPPK